MFWHPKKVYRQLTEADRAQNYCNNRNPNQVMCTVHITLLSFTIVVARVSPIGHTNRKKASRSKVVLLLESPVIATAAHFDIARKFSAHCPSKREWLPVLHQWAQFCIWFVKWTNGILSEIMRFSGTFGVNLSDDHLDGWSCVNIGVGIGLDRLKI